MIWSFKSRKKVLSVEEVGKLAAEYRRRNEEILDAMEAERPTLPKDYFNKIGDEWLDKP